MFEFAKNNTSDQCIRMSHYYSTIEDYINITDNEMLYDTSMTISIPSVCSQNHHVL